VLSILDTFVHPATRHRQSPARLRAGPRPSTITAPTLTHNASCAPFVRDGVREKSVNIGCFLTVSTSARLGEHLPAHVTCRYCHSGPCTDSEPCQSRPRHRFSTTQDVSRPPRGPLSLSAHTYAGRSPHTLQSARISVNDSGFESQKPDVPYYASLSEGSRSSLRQGADKCQRPRHPASMS